MTVRIRIPLENSDVPVWALPTRCKTLRARVER